MTTASQALKYYYVSDCYDCDVHSEVMIDHDIARKLDDGRLPARCNLCHGENVQWDIIRKPWTGKKQERIEPIR